MRLTLRRHSTGYVFTGLNENTPVSESSTLTAEEAMNELTKIGCHRRDVMDWIDFADRFGKWRVE
jgi:hypothetical protein